jgi:hypothetical protein
MVQRETPLEQALKILPKYYSANDPKQALVWYFGKSWGVLNQTSCELTKDWDDAVAWELHEIVEACESQKIHPSQKFPDWASPEFLEKQKQPHKKAVEVEIRYLRDIKRFDLVRQVKLREFIIEEEDIQRKLEEIRKENKKLKQEIKKMKREISAYQEILRQHRIERDALLKFYDIKETAKQEETK